MNKKELSKQWEEFESVQDKVSLLTSYLEYLEKGIEHLKNDPTGRSCGGWIIEGVNEISTWGTLCGHLATTIKKQHEKETDDLLKTVKRNEKRLQKLEI